MKKNVKILGAAAAALLTVAPVAAGIVPSANTVVAHAATGTGTSTDPFNVSVDYSKNLLVPSGTSANSNLLDFSASLSNGVKLMPNTVSSTVTDANNNPVTQLTSGSYTQTIKCYLSVGATNHGKYYGIGSTQYVADAQGVLHTTEANAPVATFTFTRTITVNDSNNTSHVYFDNANGTTYVNGIIYVPSTTPWSNNIFDILQNAKNVANAKVTTTDANGNISTGNANIITGIGGQDGLRQQLENQGVVINGDQIAPSTRSFYVTLTAENPNNSAQKASVRVYFQKNVNSGYYPAIFFGGTLIQQGSVHNTSDAAAKANNFTVVAGTKAARDLAANPQSGFTALNINDGTSGNADIAVVNNRINPEVAGVYPVTIQATNPDGLTTRYTFNVIVTPSNGTQATVHFVPGYGINVWGKFGNGVSFSGKRAKTGTNVTVHETTTIDGVSYSRVTYTDPENPGFGEGSNNWVMTKYLSDAWKDSEKPSNNNSDSKETALRGVATVTYNGRGSVRLLDSEGHYTNQYISKRSAWKVFAEKTINGERMYRLGSQSQWVPARFVSFN